MTAVGKILVFMTMAMSLALGTISLFVHSLVVKKNSELVEAKKTLEVNQSNIALYTKDKTVWGEERSKLERSRSDLETRLRDFDTLFKQAALEGSDPAKLNEYLSLQKKTNQELQTKLKAAEQEAALLRNDGKSKVDGDQQRQRRQRHCRERFNNPGGSDCAHPGRASGSREGPPGDVHGKEPHV